MEASYNFDMLNEDFENISIIIIDHPFDHNLTLFLLNHVDFDLVAQIRAQLATNEDVIEAAHQITAATSGTECMLRVKTNGKVTPYDAYKNALVQVQSNLQELLSYLHKIGADD